MNEKSVKGKRLSIIANVLSVAVVALTAVSIVLLFSFILRGASGFWYDNRTALIVACSVLVGATAVVAVIFALNDKSFVFRLVLMTFVILSIVLFVVHILQITGISQKISSVESLREYVAGFGGNAVFIMLVLQILQVVVLPIPGFIAVGATVALFGAFKGALISFCGIVIGSFVGFFVGRKFGYGAAAWLVGEKSLKKGLDIVKGKDKAVLTAMFTLPFFPDDVLCFVAGLSSMSLRYYSVMILVTRAVSVFATAYSVNGSLIPYDTWWGILIWAILIGLTAFASYLVYKYGEKIEEFLSRKFPSKRKRINNG